MDSLRIPSLGLTLYHFLRQQVDSLVDSLRISSLNLRISSGFSTDFVLGSTDFCASKWILFHFDALAVFFRFIYTDALIKSKRNRKTREKRKGGEGEGGSSSQNKADAPNLETASKLPAARTAHPPHLGIV